MGWIDWVPPVFHRKASAVSRALVMMTYGQPVWTPRDFAQLAEEGFEQNVTVYACVMEIARAAAGIPWVLYQQGRGGKKRIELESHPLLSLMQRPNPEQGQAAFFEAVTAYLLLSGNNYIEAVGPSETAPPMELWTLRPDRVTILPNIIQRVGGYRYKAGSVEQTFSVEQVLHQRIFHPTNDWYGLSPLAVAARSIDTDNAAQKWNAALLQNNARPSGALISKGNLSDDQFNRLKADVDEKYTGGHNAGRPLLLEGDMDWKQFSLTPAELDWIAGRKLSKQEICTAFQVPPELIGDHEHATYSNFQEARKAFYQETVLPYMDRLRDALNNWLTPKFGDNLVLDYDRDEIEALQEERQKVWTSAIEAVRAGVLTPNEARAKMGYETRPEGDVLLVSAAMLPLGSGFAPVESDGVKSVKAFGLVTDEAKTAHWKKIDREREAWAGKLAGRVRGLLDGDEKAVVAALAGTDADTAPGAVRKALAGRRGDWERTLSASYLAIIEEFGTATEEGLKAGAGPREVKAFDVWARAVQGYVAKTVAKRIKEITETTEAKVQAAIDAGFTEGDGIDAIAERVRESFQGISAARSQTIARTETIAAANFGSRAAAKQTGLPLRKEWIGTRDGRERETHGALDGAVVGMDDRYSNGLMFPGDPDGDAAEVINCRCAEGYIVEDDDQ